MTDSKTLSFVCPECGHGGIECEDAGVTVVTQIDFVGTGDVAYGSQEQYDGTDTTFQCEECGYVLDGVKTLDDLLEYLENA